MFIRISKPFTKSSLFEEGQTTKQVKFGKETDYRATNSYWFIGLYPSGSWIWDWKSFEFECRSLLLSWSNFNVIAYCILALIAIKLSGKAKQLMTMVACFQ